MSHICSQDHIYDILAKILNFYNLCISLEILKSIIVLKGGTSPYSLDIQEITLPTLVTPFKCGLCR